MIAEEAGNDREVAANLQEELDGFYSFGGVKAPRVQEQQTFAASVAGESPSCRHVDIRQESKQTTRTTNKRWLGKHWLRRNPKKLSLYFAVSDIVKT